ncbi:class I mannose-6-phosphate isomerase [Aquimarina mytili]|uniref:Phosphohexomutase n=1 Tax=Aquimarina mytili TaxID=874423 RepID=A0A937A343_9FLAO|nr:class I mannose-6-phosphate isomerase [Aquimarina mytili]
MYILKFNPILKDKIWGGTKLKHLLNKASTSFSVGESWEISDVEGDYSVVSHGELSGRTLHELLEEYKEQLVGTKNFQRFGTKFPLLIKFIDAKEDLSVQLHPGDEIAKQKHNSLGKTEMWHIVQADKDANIIAGFNQSVDKELYQKHVEQKSIKDILNYEQVSKGDTFFVYSGLIHAIGKGVLLAEIQQTSDITYRVYDWDRKDSNGKYRELHQKDALEAIDFKNEEEYKITYTPVKNGTSSLVECPHFVTNLIEVDHSMTISHKELDSFVVYMCVEGEALLQYNSSGDDVKIKFGETVLVPACIKSINIQSEGVKLLQTYI